MSPTEASPPAFAPAPGEDNALVPYTSPLSAKEQLAARIHVHLLFSPGQEETWTLLERQFPKASEKDFNSAIALLEMEDVILIDPHPHYPAEMLIKIDNSTADDPDLASVPLPFPGFRYPRLDTPLGTGRHSASTSVSLTDLHTPAKTVSFLPLSSSASRASSTRRSRVSNGAAPPARGEEDGAAPGEGWQGWAEGAWSHTPPRLSDAVSEGDDAAETLDESPIDSPNPALVGHVVAVASGGKDEGERGPGKTQRERGVGEEALIRLVEDT